MKLRTGGAVSGQLLDFNDHGLVIVADRTPFAFAWVELDGGSAYSVRRQIVLEQRGGISRFTAEDHFDLGLFALTHGRIDLAQNAFRAAAKIQPSLGTRGQNAVVEHQRRTNEHRRALESIDSVVSAADASDNGSDDAAKADGAAGLLVPDLASSTAWETIPDRDDQAELRQRVATAYLQFGEKVREVLGRDITLVETPHFLIWTDWPFRERQLLADQFEQMYTALCSQFDLDPADDIFLARCPAFCFQRAGRFRKFAQKFDGHSGKNAAGYARSNEATGHVHLALVRQGDLPADFDRFAATLVHEGTHAFVHRLYSPRLIPHWVNEGLAELMSARVLGERSPAAGNAALLARQFVRYTWPISDMLESAGPIGIHEYALAHSVIAYLEGQGRGRFAGFIRDLKAGQSTAEALAGNFDGLTLAELESRWSAHIRSQLSPPP